jgi:hypothetical protein
VLYLLGFDHLGVVVSDLYFLDPEPGPGQEGAERGVRIELRFLERHEQDGSIYASHPIIVGRPVWRADLLESVNNPGSLDRAHHHPRMRGWEPGSREFDTELTEDPIRWVAEQLEHVDRLFEGRSEENEDLSEDFEQLRNASGEIVDAIRGMLERVGTGELARAPVAGSGATLIRSGWL